MSKHLQNLALHGVHHFHVRVLPQLGPIFLNNPVEKLEEDVEHFQVPLMNNAAEDIGPGYHVRIEDSIICGAYPLL